MYSYSAPEWQRRRLEIYERDKYTCQAAGCGRKDLPLEVHHLYYFSGREEWEYPDDMLITLCVSCHKKEKNRNELETHLSNTFKSKGFLMCDLLAFSVKLETEPYFTKTLLNVLRNFQNGEKTS